ncbi:MAG: hypothetical protein Q4C95_09070 [Planctomycetia bacterium]|nr:hypothetical protein [Planctomycetia bacterium]
MNIEWQIELSRKEWFFIAILWFAYGIVSFRLFATRFHFHRLEIKKESSTVRVSFFCLIGKLLIPVFLFLLWLHPVLIVEQPGKTEILLLLDDSQSMNRPLDINNKLSYLSGDHLNFSNEDNSLLNRQNNEFNKPSRFKDSLLSVDSPFDQAQRLIDALILKWQFQSTLNVRLANLSAPTFFRKERFKGEADNEVSPIREALSQLVNNQIQSPIHSVILLSDGIENPDLSSEKLNEKYPFAINSIALGSTKTPIDLSFRWPIDLKMSDKSFVHSNNKNNNYTKKQKFDSNQEIFQNSSLENRSTLAESQNLEARLLTGLEGNISCRLNYNSLKNEANLESFLFILGLSEEELDRLPPIQVELSKRTSSNDLFQRISTQEIDPKTFKQNQHYFGKKLLFRWQPEEQDRSFRLTASFQGGKDWNDRNDYFDFILENEFKPIHVLLIDEEPRFEYRFLKELLRRESNINLNTLLLSADPKLVEIDPIAISANSLTTEKLSEYDVIIWGDVLPESLGLTFTRFEKLFQNEQSTVAFWFIAGDRFLPGQYKKTFLDSLLSNFAQTSSNETKKTGTNKNELYRIEQTDFFSEIFSNISVSDFAFDVSRIYPQPFSGDRFRILASSNNIPIFLATYSNRHKILWQGTDELWKLRCRTRPEIYGTESEVYRTFVLNCLNYLSRRDFNDQEFQEESNKSKSDLLQEKEDVCCRLAFLSKLASDSNGSFFDLSDIKYKNQAQVIEDLTQLLLKESNSRIVIQKKSAIPSIIIFGCLLILLILIWKNETT